MKVGDLVRRLDNWVKFNPWMKGIDIDFAKEEIGIVVGLPKKMLYKPSIIVLWATLGLMKEHPDDIEVICDSDY